MYHIPGSKPITACEVLSSCIHTLNYILIHICIQIKLDDVDTGAAENIIIEGGPKFESEVYTGGSLHSVDHCVILGLCLDVANSNPVVGIYTRMSLYILVYIIY